MDAHSSSKPTKTHSYVLQRDFKVLEREQKVTTLLGSEAFRSELENILRGQLEGTGEPKKTRPQSPEAISPGRLEMGHKSRHPSTVATSVMGGGVGGEPVIPINDLRGTAASKYTVAERDQRCKLASVYRLVHMFGWSQLIYNHISVSNSFTCMHKFCILSKYTCRLQLLCYLHGRLQKPFTILFFFFFSDIVSSIATR
jgi:hypothetical protein